MEFNRRELMLGALAVAASGAGLVSAEAAKTSYFAGTAVDNGVTYQADQLRQDRQEVAQAGRQV